MNYDLKQIKDKYGEKMMHLCRELFPTLLETEGLLFKLLSNSFYFSKFLYDDIIREGLVDEFKDYIYSSIDVEHDNTIFTNKTPFELMESAGYKLYECKTEEDIQKFKKYYSDGEELCTFRGGRLKSCYVFFAIKNDVEKINREDFKQPNREDLYGTSVISIQFRKGEKNNLSIKNRYNHSVNNPDNTFHNNLDNIIRGLTRSFEQYYNLNISRENGNDFELYNYTHDEDLKWFKYNYEISNVYYGYDNLIVDNFIHVPNIDKAKFLVLDYYIFDLEHKCIRCYDETIIDTFPYAFNKITKMEIQTIKDSTNKELLIYHDYVISKIVFDNKYRIIELDYNGNMTNIDCFMSYNKYLKKIKLEKALKINNYFLSHNSSSLQYVYLPNVETIQDNCLIYNTSLVSFVAPKVTHTGKYFLSSTVLLDELDLSSIEEMKESSLSSFLTPINNLKISDKYKVLMTKGKIK